MVIMAGMLPGVESARRRRVRQSSESGAARRPSLCLYAGGLGSSSSAAAAAASSKARTLLAITHQSVRSCRLHVVGGVLVMLCGCLQVWSGACGDTTAAMACAWMTTLGSDAREAKERLDHKLRGHRQPVVLKRCAALLCCTAVHSEPHHFHLYCTFTFVVASSFFTDLCRVQ